MKPYETRDIDSRDIVCTGTTAASVAVPVADLYQITFKSMVGDTVAAGDDATILVSMDGVNFNKPEAEAITLLECDKFEVLSLVAGIHITHVRATMAGVGGADVTTLTVTCINNR